MRRSKPSEARNTRWRKIHLLHLLSAVFAFAAFILAFLCLFAGSKLHFMSDYPILTVSPHTHSSTQTPS